MSTTAAAAPVRLGLVGLGRSGWDIHARAVAARDDAVIVAAADPEPGRRAEASARFGCRTSRDPGKVIADDGVDLVVIASPSHLHHDQTLAALGQGKHVVVEKPFARSVTEVDEMIAAAAAAHRMLTCYQPCRFDADFRVVQRVVAAGHLGDLTLVRRARHGFSRRTDWQTLRAFDGGSLSNTAPHLLDQVLQLVPPDVELDLLADLRQTVGAGDAEDHAVMVLRPRGPGPLLQVEASSAVAIPQPDWVVLGTAGALVGTTGALRLRRSDPTAWPPLAADPALAAAGRSYGEPEDLAWTEETIEVTTEGRPVDLFYDDLVTALRTGAEPAVTAASVRRQIDLLERARRLTGYL